MSSEIVEVKKALKTQLRPAIENALPSHIPPDRFVRIAQSAVISNPKLINCDRNSLMKAFVLCAEKGLLPNGHEAAIIPFGSKANLVETVAGKLKLIRNSGEVGNISAHIVRETDHFEYGVNGDNGEWVNFRPDIFASNRGEIRGAFAMAQLVNGGVLYDFMSLETLMERKEIALKKLKYQNQIDNHVWNTWPEEMMKKTVLGRLAKRLPKSTDKEMETIIPQTNPQEEDKTVQVSNEESQEQDVPMIDDAVEVEDVPDMGEE